MTYKLSNLYRINVKDFNVALAQAGFRSRAEFSQESTVNIQTIYNISKKPLSLRTVTKIRTAFKKRNVDIEITPLV